MKLFFHGVLLTLLTMLPMQASAQLLSSTGRDSNVFEIVPTEVWHYGKAGAIEGNVCIFSNLFSNGFVLQLLEKDEVIRAVVIDFGQAVFEEGLFYPFILSMNGKPTEVRGVAVTRSSIRFNLTVPVDTAEFEEYATNSLKAKTEESDFVFFLNGLSDAFKTINDCSINAEDDPFAKQKFVETEKETLKEEVIEKVEALEPVKPVTEEDAELEELLEEEVAEVEEPQEVKQEEVASKENEVMAEVEEKEQPKKERVATLPITNSKRVAPVPAIPAMDDDEIVRLVKMLEAQKNGKVTVSMDDDGDKGNTIFDKQAKMFKEGQKISRDEALAMMEGNETPVNETAQAIRDEAMSEQFKWQAKKGEMLSAVVTRWADEEGVKIKWQADNDPVLDANIALDLPFDKAVSVLMESVRQSNGQPFYASVRENANDVDLVKEDRIGDWRALLGMDLHAVLESWSDKAQVQLIWDVDAPYRVQKEYRQRASYAEAVTDLLDQFKHLKKRPVAQLNVDPVTGQLALIVSAQKK